MPRLMSGTYRTVRPAADACLLLALAVTGCATAPRRTPCAKHAAAVRDYREAIQQRLDAFRQRVGAPGATAAFVLADGCSGAVASGVSNKSTGQPMQPDDRMLAGSVGKMHVAAVMLQLVEAGHAELDAKISRWVGGEPWFPRLPNAHQITLRHLMNHTSGMPEHVTLPEMIAALAATPDKVWRPEELVALVLDKEPVCPVGECWSYADTNYILVGMIIERITGRTYYGELTTRILEPLRLTDTIPSDRNPLPGLVDGYTFEQNPFPVPEVVVSNGRCAFNPQMEWTGGGLLSTSRDLARWARLLYAGDVLKPETKDAMLSGVDTPRWPNTTYGLGVIIRQTEHGPAYGHAGWFPGYVTIVSYYPRLEVALAAQLNSDAGASSEALASFLDELAECFPSEPRTIDAANCASYATPYGLLLRAGAPLTRFGSFAVKSGRQSLEWSWSGEQRKVESDRTLCTMASGTRGEQIHGSDQICERTPRARCRRLLPRRDELPVRGGALGHARSLRRQSQRPDPRC